MAKLSEEVAQVVTELNPWWPPGRPIVRPAPPKYRRPLVVEISSRLRRRTGPIEVIRGPRQVGKTTGIHQIVQDLIAANVAPAQILFIRFDLELLREEPSALRSILSWYSETIRKKPLNEGKPTYLFLDEIHKLDRWDEEVKHIGDTFKLRMLLTGSSSVLVARGGRESLAGRVFTTELPTFSFREVVECWKPELAEYLPNRIRFSDAMDGALVDSADAMQALRPQQKLSIRRQLERYYIRGGYPRLHSGEIDQDLWSDYIVQTVFENVLGADIPDLFPVERPELLRHLYLSVARMTGQIVPQKALADIATESGFSTNQPTVGKYLHYLGDALLIREFKRYPLAKKASARVPAKLCVSDLGVRNAIFRGAPSLWESDPGHLGSLVETMAQSAIRDHGLQVHYFREHENPKNRRSPFQEVDFVPERVDGNVLPVEIKFRSRVRERDISGVNHFLSIHGQQTSNLRALVVTRDFYAWDSLRRILFSPLASFLLAF